MEPMSGDKGKQVMDLDKEREMFREKALKEARLAMKVK